MNGDYGGHVEPSELASPPFEIIAIGASAGGLTALKRVLGDLPADLPVPILVVQHLDRRHRSLMADILGRHTDLVVREAQEGAELEPGVVYIALPDHHLLVTDDHTLSLPRSELVRFVRPSVDLLFDSVAGAFGDQAIGVVLTGTGQDGTDGAQTISARGGTVIVQDPATAEFAGMPQNAAATGVADFVLPLEEIGPALVRLVTHEAG